MSSRASNDALISGPSLGFFRKVDLTEKAERCSFWYFRVWFCEDYNGSCSEYNANNFPNGIILCYDLGLNPYVLSHFENKEIRKMNANICWTISRKQFRVNRKIRHLSNWRENHVSFSPSIQTFDKILEKFI